MSTIVPDAERLAERVASAYWGIAFDHAVAHFAQFLATVPDYRPREVTAADVETLRRLADEVIQQIERRLNEHGDRQSVERHLAGAVYSIRRETESIAVWHRHYSA